MNEKLNLKGHTFSSSGWIKTQYKITKHINDGLCSLNKFTFKTIQQ